MINVNEILSTPQQVPQSESPEKPSNNDDFNGKLAALARMERKMREKDQGYASKDKEWEEKSRKLSEYEELVKLMDENPIEAIKKRKGWGLQEINEFAVQNSTDEDLDPVARLTQNFQKQMAELKASMSTDFEGKIKAKEEEYAKKDYDYQINQFKGNIKSFLSENKAEYEFIGSLNKDEDGSSGEDAVYDLIYADVMKRKESYEKAKESGEEVDEPDLTPMAFKDAADKLEAYLDTKAQRFLSLNKVKNKFSSDKPDLGQFIAQSQQPKTLNNSFAPKSQSIDQSNPEERRKAAEDLLKSWYKNS